MFCKPIFDKKLKKNWVISELKIAKTDLIWFYLTSKTLEAENKQNLFWK